MKTARNNRLQRGVTLIESLVVTGLVAVSASVVAPGMAELKLRQQLTHAAAEFETDVQQVRSAAVARNASLRISFDNRHGASCYIVHSGAAGDCECGAAGTAVCVPGAEALRSVHFASVAGNGNGSVALAPNVRSITFDPVHGTSTPAGTVRFVGRGGVAVHQVVNVMGRVRSCSPAPAVQGFKAC